MAELLPRWSGELLDFVVDFPTYVFVPAYALAAGGLLPPAAALPLGLIVTVTGALYFADRRMKTPTVSLQQARICCFPGQCMAKHVRGGIVSALLVNEF